MNSANDEPQVTEKLIILEEKLSFQQLQLDQLNLVIVEQQTELERLRRELAGLTEAMRGVIASSGSDLPHERPPHY